MDNYIDALFQNNLEESSPEFDYDTNLNGNNTLSNGMSGGANNNDVPNGGFLPIYLCESAPGRELLEEEKKAKREYKTHKTSIDIKTILEKRRKATPFIKT